MKRLLYGALAIFLIMLAVIIIPNKSNLESNTTEPKKTTTTTTNKSTKKEATITVVGDLLFESPFYKAVDSGYDQNVYFELVKEYFQQDDLSIGNMEVVIGNENLQVSGDGYNFCAPKYIGDLVNTLGFEVLSTANNHSYDRGFNGVISTIDYFSNTNTLTVGTYKNNEDKNKNHILNINNINFGFLSYTLGTNQKIDPQYKDLINLYRDPSTKEIYKELLRSEITKLREKVDVLIVLMHWGQEFTYTPNTEQKELAKFLNELGVDIIVGSHSHCMQPIEIIGTEHKTLTFYSLGNFVSADDDIARTAPGNEEFDNSYQIGLLSQINISINNNKISFDNIKTQPVINYFDNSMNNFKLIPYNQYTSDFENSHLRFNKGLTKEFISKTFNNIIKEEYR